QIIFRSFGQDLIEKSKFAFVPFVGVGSRGVGARPVIEISDWLYIVRPAFAGGPDANHFDSMLRCLSQGLRHVCAIVVAIHDSHVRANKSERSAVDDES